MERNFSESLNVHVHWESPRGASSKQFFLAYLVTKPGFNFFFFSPTDHPMGPECFITHFTKHWKLLENRKFYFLYLHKGRQDSRAWGQILETVVSHRILREENQSLASTVSLTSHVASTKLYFSSSDISSAYVTGLWQNLMRKHMWKILKRIEFCSKSKIITKFFCTLRCPRHHQAALELRICLSTRQALITEMREMGKEDPQAE